MNIPGGEASTSFGRGFSCTQAVLAAFCGKYGLDRQTALKIASGFSSGMQAADVCGAVSGAIMVIGLKDGYVDPDDKSAKHAALNKTREFCGRFKERHAFLTCRDLLGCDVTTPEGKRAALEGGLFTTRCPEFVADAAAFLAEMGY